MKPADTQLMEREVRLGIVLYGGVSLAIYENGVAQELFRAVKGEGVYSFIKQLTDSDIVVDVISGTSAGGINGVLLGYALANHRDFRGSAKLWREDGDIFRLLRHPGDGASTSLLDSTGYYQERLQAAFDRMPAYRTPLDGLKTPQRVVSDIQELDLFVTSTDIDGQVFTVFDEQGHAIDVKEHRQVFVLSYRAGRKSEFDPEESASLAKLCRATSGFPVAFEPVRVNPGDPCDAALVRWGRLDDRKEIHFMDGGVLNNKPFSYTIDAITRRMADRSVERMLLYVEPDPERFERESEGSTPPLPNVVQSATDALISIPGYQSIAADLQSIAAQNDRVQIFEDLIAVASDGAGAPDRIGARRDDSAAITDTPRRAVWEAARLGQLRDRAIEGILKTGGLRRLLTEQARHAATILVESFDNWKDTPDGATLQNFDVYYRKRRLLRVTDAVRRLVADNKTPSATKVRYRVLWRKLNHQFKLLEEIQFALESAIDQAPIPWMDLAGADALPENAVRKWELAQNVLTAVLDTTEVNLDAVFDQSDGDAKERAERAAFIVLLRGRIAAAKDANPAVASKVSGNLLKRCDELERMTLERYAPRGPADPVSQEYYRFPVIDSLLFPMQRISQSESIQQIRTTRISPIDSRRGFGNRTLDEKLCGNELGHFGGFLKQSWRANDTMWGRLDATGQLIECLVTPERMKQVSQNAVSAALQMDLEAVFPNSPAGVIDTIRTLAPRLPAGDAATFEDFWNALVEASQGQIADEEVPRVITAAIDQHHAWNQFPVETPAPPLFTAEQVWKVSPRCLDSGIAGYAASMMARDLQPTGGWPEFLKNQYRVGSEKWNEDIPAPVLIEMMAQTALVLRNCLLAIAGPFAQKIQRAPLYKFGIDLPLWVTYRFARLQRTRPEFVWVTLVAAFLIPAAVLALEYVFWEKSLNVRGMWQIALWILGPFVIWSFLLLFLIALSASRKRKDANE